MKKFVAVLLCIAMVMTSTLPAFAAEGEAGIEAAEAEVTPYSPSSSTVTTAVTPTDTPSVKEEAYLGNEDVNDDDKVDGYINQFNTKAQKLADENKKPKAEQDQELISSLNAECESLKNTIDGLTVSEEKKMEIMNSGGDYPTSIDQEMVYHIEDRKIYQDGINDFQYQTYDEDGSGNLVTQTTDIEYSGKSYCQVAGDVAFIIEQDASWLNGAPDVGTSLAIDDETKCRFASDADKALLESGVQRALIIETDGRLHGVSVAKSENSITVNESLNMYRCIETIHLEENSLSIPVPAWRLRLGIDNYLDSCGGKLTLSINGDISFKLYGIKFDIESCYYILSIQKDGRTSHLYLNSPLPVTVSVPLVPGPSIPIGWGFVADFGPTLSAGGDGVGDAYFNIIYAKEGFKANFTVTWLGVPWISSSEALTAPPEFEIKEAHINGEEYLSVDLGVTLTEMEFVGLGIAFSTGLVLKGSQNDYDGFDPKDKQKTRWHACKRNECVEISANTRLGPLGVNIVALKALVSYPLFDVIKAKDYPPFYAGYDSKTFGDHGGTLCPHWGHRLNVYAYSNGMFGRGVEGAEIWYETPGKRFEDCSYTYRGVTDRSGCVSLYAPAGQEITVHVKLKDGREDSRTITKKDCTESMMFKFDMGALSFDKNTEDQCSDIPNPVYYTLPSSSSFVREVKIRIPDAVPKRTGYVFKCWNDQPDGKGKYTCASGESITIKGGVITPPEPPAKMYAQWEGYTPGWFIVFNPNGGAKAPATQIIGTGEDAELTEEAPVWETEEANGNPTFQGWSTEVGGEVKYKPGDIVRCDPSVEFLTLYAAWNLSPDKRPLKISFNGNGLAQAVIPPEKWVRSGEWISLDPAVPPLGSDALFLGWSTDKAAIVPEYPAGAPCFFSEDTELFAVWILSEVDAPPKALELTYNGCDQILVNAGSTKGGIMQYALGKDDVTAPADSAFSYNIPGGKNAGDYYVWYRVKRNDSYGGSDPKCVKSNISKAKGHIYYKESTIRKDPGDDKFVNKLDNPGVGPDETGDGSVTYSSSDTNVATVDPATGEVTVIAKGHTTITATAADGNNYAYEDKDASYLLAVGDNIIIVTAQGWEGNYDGQEHGITVKTVPEDATVKYGTIEGEYDLDESPKFMEGTHKVYYRVTKPDFADVLGECFVKINRRAVVTKPPVPIEGLYYLGGQTMALVEPGEAERGEMCYFLTEEEKETPESDEYTSAIPRAVHAGDYYVWYMAKGIDGQESTEPVRLKVTVSKADQDTPKAPKLSLCDTKSITLEYLPGMEYRMEQNDWQTSPMFTGLEPYTRYKFYQRLTGSSDLNESDPSPAVEYMTEWEGDPVVFNVKFSDSAITGNPYTGLSYDKTNRRYERAFTGSAIKPAVEVTGAGVLLKEGTDYSVSYSSNVNASDKPVKVTVTGKGDYAGKKTLEFYILRADLEVAKEMDRLKMDDPLSVKKGSKIKPVIFYGDYQLKSSDFELSNKSSIEGNTTVDIYGARNFSGTISGITVKALTKEQVKAKTIGVKVKAGSHVYDGSAQTLGKEELTVTDGLGAALTEGTDYEVTYISNTNAGKATVVVTGRNGFLGTVTKTFNITPDKKADIKAGLKDPDAKVYYSAKGAAPEVVVTVTRGDRQADLENGKDYKIKYSGNKKLGQAKYNVTFLGNYKGHPAVPGAFTIERTDISGAEVIVPDMVYSRPGKYYASPYVSLSHVTLKKGDFSVKYYDEKGTEINPKDKLTMLLGETKKTITVRVEGTGKYTGAAPEATYDILREKDGADDMSKVRIVAREKSVTGKDVPVGTQDYTGLEIMPLVRVLIKDGKVWREVTRSGYEVLYINNVEKGKAVILVTGDGKEAVGSKAVTFNIKTKKISGFFGTN